MYGGGIRRLYGAGIKKGYMVVVLGGCMVLVLKGMYGADQHCGTKRGSVVQRGCSESVVPKR